MNKYIRYLVWIIILAIIILVYISSKSIYKSETKDFSNNQVSFSFSLNEEGKSRTITGRFLVDPSLRGIVKERLIMLELTHPDGTKELKNVTMSYATGKKAATSLISLPQELIKIESQKGDYTLLIKTLSDDEERTRLNGAGILKLRSVSIKVK